MLQVAINIASLMRRRLCDQLHGGLSQLLLPRPARRRLIASYIADDRNLCLPNLHSTPPLGGVVTGVPVGTLPWRLIWKKTRMVWLPDSEKNLNIRLLVLSCHDNPRTWPTDRHTQTHTDTAWQHRPRLYSIARQKLWFMPECLECEVYEKSALHFCHYNLVIWVWLYFLLVSSCLYFACICFIAK